MFMLLAFKFAVSNHIARRINRRIRLPQRFNDTFATSIGRPKVDEQYLIEIVMDDVVQLAAALNQLAFTELAFEHAVLQVIAPVPHRLIDFAKPLIVTNVIGNDIRMPHAVARRV